MPGHTPCTRDERYELVRLAAACYFCAGKPCANFLLVCQMRFLHSDVHGDVDMQGAEMHTAAAKKLLLANQISLLHSVVLHGVYAVLTTSRKAACFVLVAYMCLLHVRTVNIWSSLLLLRN